MNIHESLSVILAGGSRFAESFYARFQLEHPEIFRHFEGMKMKQQAHLLTTSLVLIVGDFEKRTESIQEYLRVLGTRHHHRQIDKADYAAWQNSLEAALAEFHGTEWSPELARQWRSAMEMAIAQMIVGYSQQYHV